ncbi:MAG TPA: ABC transporter ATP-binding protein [Kiloniellales bacterium]|nr:ABC transporter ATP-binding protein [Kiloniellales bacterium]
MTALDLEHVSHDYGDIRAVDDLTLSIDPGELVCLLGPSGCGKTTALRVAAGLERLQAGRVKLDGKEVAGEGIDQPPEERNIGLVFQDYALFPHLDVIENVSFGLSRLRAAQRRDRARQALALVGMVEYAKAYPDALSGGQQQRVALARALAPNPRVILLDEPFSGLDSLLRNQVRDDTLHVLKKSGTATLMVTHDPEEAMFMADRVALMRDGRLVQVGRPIDLYCAPADAFVASFFGDVNRLDGITSRGRVATPFGALEAGHLAEGTEVEVLIRPEALRLLPMSGGGQVREAEARVMAARMLGRSSLIHLSVRDRGNGADLHMHARIPGRYLPPEDQILAVQLDRSQAFVFPKQTM